jgi:hypothetical protein
MRSFILGAAFVLLSAGVAYAGIDGIGGDHLVGVSVPTMMPWGMVGTAVAMGLGGVYFLFKRNK